MPEEAEDLASFKVAKLDKMWAEDEQKMLTRAGTSKCNQWDLFALMRAAYVTAKNETANPRISSLGESPASAENSRSTPVVDSVTLSSSDFASLQHQLNVISKQNAAILAQLKSRGTTSKHRKISRNVALERETAEIIGGVESALRRKGKVGNSGKTMGQKARADTKPVPRVVGQ